MPIAFENTFAEALEGLYVPWTPKGFASPELVLFNAPLAQSLGLEPLGEDEAARIFSGTKIPSSARPLAQAYAGHQFGGFSPQLGDGRALLVGELVDPGGQRFDLHLKGSGPTPFSRGGDGKATLGPMLREYVIGEAMHHLGLPTTRALAVVRTGEPVMRETALPGAVLARIGASHLRVGTLEYFSTRGELEKLQRLVRYTLERHYPDRVELAEQGNDALELLRVVSLAQAQLIAQWMHIGFIHGVMNTDNMTLSGETIDYGPCAFMDAYEPATVFSSIDHGGRYAYGNQPAIGRWNLARMGEALLPILAPTEEAAIELVHASLELYLEAFRSTWQAGMRTKLGLRGNSDQDETLVADLFDWMQATHQDYTSTFRTLAAGLRADTPPFSDEVFTAWFARWRVRHADASPRAIADEMDRVNPIYVPRNHLVEAALGAAVRGDLGPFRTLVEVVSSPFVERPGRAAYAEPAPADFGPYRTFCGT